MGTGPGEARERSGGVGDRLFEEAENGMLCERGEEDREVKGHQVLLRTSLSECCEGRGV